MWPIRGDVKPVYDKQQNIVLNGESLRNNVYIHVCGTCFFRYVSAYDNYDFTIIQP